MKKLLLLFALIPVFALADYPIQPQQVPANQQAFIKEHFKQTITFAKKDMWEVEAYLQDGTKVEFKNGNFKEAKGFNLPSTMLPQGVQNTIKTQFKGQNLTQIDVKYYGYELEFNGMLEVKISPTGQILHQKFD